MPARYGPGDLFLLHADLTVRAVVRAAAVAALVLLAAGTARAQQEDRIFLGVTGGVRYDGAGLAVPAGVEVGYLHIPPEEWFPPQEDLYRTGQPPLRWFANWGIEGSRVQWGGGRSRTAIELHEYFHRHYDGQPFDPRRGGLAFGFGAGPVFVDDDNRLDVGGQATVWGAWWIFSPYVRGSWTMRDRFGAELGLRVRASVAVTDRD